MFFRSMLILWVAWLITACAPATQTIPAPSATQRAGELTPYTPQPSRTLTPTNPGTPTPLPSLTPTPLTHIVAAGEDMFGIAYRYGLPLDAMMTANPTVNPRAMSVGTVLLVPAGARPTPTVANPTPTPLPVAVGLPDCYRSQDGSLTCLALVSNGTGEAVENVSGVIRLRLTDSGEIREWSAFPLLNRLPAGSSLPLVVVIPAPAPERYEVSVELVTALPLAEGDARYLDAEFAGLEVAIAAGGLSAQVSGQVRLATGAGEASTVWVTATAFDAQGRVVGVRRWENVVPLQAGASLDFGLVVYSLGDEIQRVETLVEARP